jgi:hypothetical protein
VLRLLSYPPIPPLLLVQLTAVGRHRSGDGCRANPKQIVAAAVIGPVLASLALGLGLFFPHHTSLLCAPVLQMVKSIDSPINLHIPQGSELDFAIVY